MNESQVKFVAAGATTMTSAAFQITTIVGNDWIRHHISPEWVLPLWGVAIALWVWWWMTRKSRRSASATQSVGEGNVVGRDNSGRLIANVEHYYEAPVIAAPPAGEPMWDGVVTDDKIDEILRGLLIPSQALSKALASECRASRATIKDLRNPPEDEAHLRGMLAYAYSRLRYASHAGEAAARSAGIAFSKNPELRG